MKITLEERKVLKATKRSLKRITGNPSGNSSDRRKIRRKALASREDQ